MQNSKLLNLIKSFSAVEKKSFSVFLESPFFNKKEVLKKLWIAIEQQAPFINSEKISKEFIFGVLFPGEEYDDKKMRYLMSDLYKLLLHFLLINEINPKSVSSSLSLIDTFIDRKLDKQYIQEINQLSKKLSQAKIHDQQYYLDKIEQADKEQHFFASKNSRKFDNKIQYGSDNLNRYFALKKLIYACAMLDRQSFLRGSYDLDLPDNFIPWLEKNGCWNEQIITIYLTIFKMLNQEEDTSYFDDLFQLLNEDTSSISFEDLKSMLLYAINFCVRKMRRGETDYVEKALNLYLLGIHKNILLEDNYLTPWTFGNVVKLELRLNRYDWVENFIKKYKNKLHPDSKDNTIAYNLAEVYCHKGDYDTALSHLSKVEFSDLSHHLGSRIMLSKIYYELDEEEALLSLLSAFNIFLKRNKKISDTIKKTCLNFCKVLFLLVRGKPLQAERELSAATLLAERAWLQKKIAQFKPIK